MNEPPLTAERVAAFLDGRMSGEERLAVLAQLAADPEWRDIAIDAAAVRDEVEGSAHVGEKVPLPFASRRSAATRWMPWLALAAAACVAVFVLVRRDDAAAVPASDAPVAPVQALALSVSDEAARALTRERWQVVRAETVRIDDVARAVRLGALSVDALLDLAGEGADARAEMVELLEPLNGAVARKLLSEARDSAALVDALDAARGLVAHEAFDVGVWLELLRAGSEAARTAPDMHALLRRVADAKQLSPEQAAELADRIRRLESNIRSEDQAAIRELASAVLTKLAS